MRKSAKFGFFVALTIALLAGGCSVPDMTASTPESTDALLEAEGRLHLVDTEEDYNPVQQHMKARKQVNPSDTAHASRYTSTGKPVEETHFRVLRLTEDTQDADAKLDKLLPPKTDLIVSDDVLLRAALKQKPVMPAEGGPRSSVFAFRVGEHPDKTRFVLDMTAAGVFEYKLDNDKSVLLIDLPETGWTYPENKVFDKHPLIQAYIAKPSPTGGTMLAVRLRKPARVIMSVAYKPGLSRGDRIVFDIAPLEDIS